MKRVLFLICLFTLLLGCTSSPTAVDGTHYVPSPGAIVLRVKVVDVQFTDLFPGCDDNEDCIPMSFWYKYRASVKQVISGAWSQPSVEFTHLQHALYINDVTKDCYVVLVPAGEEIRSRVGVPFIAETLLSRFFSDDRSSIKALRH